MNANWNRGWRKLVEWDNVNKVYVYKGNRIYPLSYKEQIEMPTHLQNEYYWGEIAHIDKIVEEEERRTERTPNADGQTAEEALKLLWEFWEIQ